MLSHYLSASLFILFQSLVLAVIYWARRRDAQRPPIPPGKSFVVSNMIAHRRLLPVQSKHFFSYRTVSVLVSLKELETNQLDVAGGWLFGYGSNFNVTGIHPRSYLTDILAKPKGAKPVTIREKLDALLCERGWDTTAVTDVWLGVMPSFFGYVGTNPVTSYYVYKNTVGPSGAVEPRLWLVVLEVDNTYGEKHIYVLETGVNEAPGFAPCSTYDHCWIAPRQFHVSPFNDRSGFYRVYVRAIPAPSQCDGSKAPRPMIKLDLLTDTDPHRIKMIATQSCVASAALAPASLLAHLAKAPLCLALTFHRIMYQAFLLHYRKRCDVYPRAEPTAQLAEVEAKFTVPERNPIQGTLPPVSNGTGWIGETSLECWARHRVETFIEQRVQAVGGIVKLVSSNPLIPSTTYIGLTKSASTQKPLEIHFRSSRFFTIMVLSPTPLHALLLGSDSERVFTTSSRDVFLSFFSSPPSKKSIFSSFIHSTTQTIRAQLIPDHILALHPIPTNVQPLDSEPTLSLLFLVFLLYVSDRAGEKLYNTLGARFVPDRNPWRSWDRVNAEHKRYPDGSVYRPLQS